MLRLLLDWCRAKGLVSGRTTIKRNEPYLPLAADDDSSARDCCLAKQIIVELRLLSAFRFLQRNEGCRRSRLGAAKRGVEFKPYQKPPARTTWLQIIERSATQTLSRHQNEVLDPLKQACPFEK